MAKDRLLKNTFIYFIGTMATRLLNLLMLPLYTDTIPTDGMGYYSLVYTTVSVAVPALLFMVWDVYLRFSLDCDTDEARGRVTTVVLLSTGVLMALYLVVFIAVGSAISLDYLLPTAFMALTWPLAYIWQSGMRVEGKNKLYAITGIAATAVNILVSLLFIIVLKLPVLSQYVSQAAALLTIFVIAEPNIKLFAKIKPRSFDWAVLKRMLRFGLPLVANTVAFWFISGVSGYVIEWNINTSAVGIFNAANRFSMVIATLTSIFYLAWQEEAFREAKSEKLQGYMSDVLKKYQSVLFAGVCFGLPVLKLVYPWFVKGEYTQSWVYVPAVIMTAVFSALSSYAGTSFGAKMKTGSIMVTTIVGGAVSFLLSWFGVRFFGIHAVAIAGGVGFLVTFLMRVALSRKIMPIRVNWLSLLALNAAVAAVIYVYYAGGVWAQIAASVAGLALFIILNRKLILSVFQKVRYSISSRS